MAHKKYANALTSETDIHFERWMDEVRKQHEGVVSSNHINRIASTVLRKADPKQFLLSHATIVASVDTYKPKNVKLGAQFNRGVQINVKYPDYRVKPEYNKYVNNNYDAWDRRLLLASYKTFVGANSYVEHLQIPELSKGFIVDAIARDLGETCYVDILVATDRRHAKLIQDILSGDMNALSMGAISQFTICTKCGNVAIDTSDLCACIQYEGKGKFFQDENGEDNIICELIGHYTQPGSNQFIEASWVKNPAFKGAVRRSFLNQDMIEVASKLDKANKVHEIHQFDPIPEGLKHAASVYRYAEDEAPAPEPTPKDDALSTKDEAPLEDEAPGGNEPAGGELDLSALGGDVSSPPTDSEGKEKSTDDKDPHKDFVSNIMKKMYKLISDKLEEEMASALKPENVATVTTADKSINSGNDSIVRSSTEFSKKLRHKFAGSSGLIEWAECAHKIVHTGGLKAVKAARMTSKDLLTLSWIEDSVNGREADPKLYKIAINIGSPRLYKDFKSYLIACEQQLNKPELGKKEREFFVVKGRIASIV